MRSRLYGNADTRQKEKSKNWRVRSHPQGNAAVSKGTQIHAKKKKARIGVCGAVSTGTQVHAKKKKARIDVCGAVSTGTQVHVKKKKARIGVCGAVSKGTESPPREHPHAIKRQILH